MNYQYGNVLTNERCNALPVRIGGTTNPTWAICKAAGYRLTAIEDTPAEGYRATGWRVDDIDGETCHAVMLGQVNIAEEEEAARVARRAEAKATLDDDPVLQTLLWGIVKCAVKSGLAVDDAAAKQLLITYFDAIPL